LIVFIEVEKGDDQQNAYGEDTYTPSDTDCFAPLRTGFIEHDGPRI
jgi:hypothetical protein